LVLKFKDAKTIAQIDAVFVTVEQTRQHEVKWKTTAVQLPWPLPQSPVKHSQSSSDGSLIRTVGREKDASRRCSGASLAWHASVARSTGAAALS
jgi:hypothetical protein